MEKFSTKLKSFFIIFAIAFVLFWVLVFLANYAWGVILYCVLLFPFGFLHFKLGNYLLRDYSLTHWIDIQYVEYVELFLAFLVIIGQTFVYYYIYKFIKARKKRKMEIQEWKNFRQNSRPFL